MRNLNIVCPLALIFLVAGAVHAATSSKSTAYSVAKASGVNLPKSVRKALQNADIPVTALGVYVQEVYAKKPKIKSQENLAFLPASTIKLLTADAALNLLGPTYTWKTRVYGQGKLQGDIWQGDLIIKGSLDPKLVQENLWLMLRQLRTKGIRHIHGNIVLDRSAYPAPELETGKFDGDPVRAYNVGPDALLLNFKSVRMYFKVDASNQVQVVLDPPLPSMNLGVLRTGEGKCGDWRDQLGLVFAEKQIQFSGSYARSCGDQVWDVHPYSLTQDAYFGAVLRNMWREVGGSLQGGISSRDATIPFAAQDATLLVEWQSPSVAEIIRDMNKFSNNVMARQVMLTLGADENQVSSSERGVQKMKEWLASRKIDAPELIIENGAGLSRNERISPQSMAKLLLAVFQSPVMPEFIASLPVVGFDGTMRNRLKQSPVAGRAHIKTGTLNDVRAIAGYVLAESGKRYVVVAFLNHSRAPEGKAALDALLEWVYEEG